MVSLHHLLLPQGEEARTGMMREMTAGSEQCLRGLLLGVGGSLIGGGLIAGED